MVGSDEKVMKSETELTHQVHAESQQVQMAIDPKPAGDRMATAAQTAISNLDAALYLYEAIQSAIYCRRWW